MVKGSDFASLGENRCKTGWCNSAFMKMIKGSDFASLGDNRCKTGWCNSAFMKAFQYAHEKLKNAHEKRNNTQQQL